MDKEKNLLLKKMIHVEQKGEMQLFSSQTLKEMEMANLIGGDEPVPYGLVDMFCGTNIICPNVNVVCSQCMGPPKPPPPPGPTPGPSYSGTNCICT